ncbi:MAG: hypothetical protein N2Z72_05550 [Bacteroidales bacterium]|nr:hypothetical protein [Bacteroidales bacterium]
MRLQRKVFNFFYQKKKQHFHRHIQGIPYYEANSLLLVVDYKRAEDIDIFYRIGTQLIFDNKDYLMLLWTEQKKQSLPFPDSHHYLLIGHEDFTFLKTPKNDHRFFSLLQKPFDLFMDLTRLVELPLLWIAEFNHAKLKIGFNKFSSPVFDVNIHDTFSRDLTAEEIFRIFVQYSNWLKVQKKL